jgi:hypothetical protein
MGQAYGNYQILKTNNAYVIKTETKDYTRIDTESPSLGCSTTELSKELNFEHIAHYFDEETRTLFRNMKIQARVYIDIQGAVQDLYFISENDPEEHGIDFKVLTVKIQRKLKIYRNKACLPKFEDKYISWYIPMYQY